MANVTIQEFYSLPDKNGDVPRKADIKTTIDATSTLSLNDNTRYVIISANSICRVSWDGVAAVDSDENILSALSQAFLLAPGVGRTLKFYS